MNIIRISIFISIFILYIPYKYILTIENKCICDDIKTDINIIKSSILIIVLSKFLLFILSLCILNRIPKFLLLIYMIFFISYIIFTFLFIKNKIKECKCHKFLTNTIIGKQNLRQFSYIFYLFLILLLFYLFLSIILFYIYKNK